MKLKYLMVGAVAASLSLTTAYAADTRKVDSLFGVVELPVVPKSVFVEDPWTLGNVLALGVKPVAVAVFKETSLDYLGDRMDGVKQISWGDDGPSVEEIASLNPDLVVSRGGNSYGNFNEERCNNYAQISATYCFFFAWETVEEMHANLNSVADALNKKDEAAELIEKYDRRIASLKARVEATDLVNKTIAVLRIRPSGYQYRNGQEGILIKAIGLKLPADQMDPKAEFEGAISLENLDVIQADIIFVQVDPGMDDKLKAMQDNPLYASLPAVKNNQVFMANTGVWNSFDFIAQHTVMDELEKFLIIPAEASK
ncbi:MAG: iron-siderophore ABC transporter substrate-binding protein [Alphaproteobacteria bacterium]|nr:iron-siderophore ABC transporter substrate-binding protein [Alphaproteobacteria bacterium]